MAGGDPHESNLAEVDVDLALVSGDGAPAALAEVGREVEAEQCAAASAAWSVLAEDLYAASESDEPKTKLWDAVRGSAAAVLDAETLLWDSLGRA